MSRIVRKLKTVSVHSKVTPRMGMAPLDLVPRSDLAADPAPSRALARRIRLRSAQAEIAENVAIPSVGAVPGVRVTVRGSGTRRARKAPRERGTSAAGR